MEFTEITIAIRRRMRYDREKSLRTGGSAAARASGKIYGELFLQCLAISGKMRYNESVSAAVCGGKKKVKNPLTALDFQRQTC